MSDRVFVDSNCVLYLFSEDEAGKRTAITNRLRTRNP